MLNLNPRVMEHITAMCKELTQYALGMWHDARELGLGYLFG